MIVSLKSFLLRQSNDPHPGLPPNGGRRYLNRRIHPSEQDICQLDRRTDGFSRRSRNISYMDGRADGFTRRTAILKIRKNIKSLI